MSIEPCRKNTPLCYGYFCVHRACNKKTDLLQRFGRASSLCKQNTPFCYAHLCVHREKSATLLKILVSIQPVQIKTRHSDTDMRVHRANVEKHSIEPVNTLLRTFLCPWSRKKTRHFVTDMFVPVEPVKRHSVTDIFLSIKPATKNRQFVTKTLACIEPMQTKTRHFVTDMFVSIDYVKKTRQHK